MISRKQIKTIISQYVLNQQNSEFAIFPFGENGINVKQILEECFGIRNVILVDTMLSEYNEGIINLDEFAKKAKGTTSNIVLFYTLEDKEGHDKLLKKINELCQDCLVVDLLDLSRSEVEIWQDYSSYYFSSFLPSSVVDHEDELSRKIKVRVYNFTDNCWNTLESVAAEFFSDNQIDLLIISREKSKSGLVYENINSKGYKHVFLEEYDVRKDLPDIFFLCHSCDYFTQIPELNKYCKLVVAATSDLLRYTHEYGAFWAMYNRAYQRFCPDYFLFDSLLFNDIKMHGYYSKRIVEMGNAKFDSIYNSVNSFSIPRDWAKLRLCDKVFMYATDHGVRDLIITEDITFDLYAKQIFELANKNPRIGLIFRPHPSLINELKHLGIWNDKSIERFKEYCEKTPNIVFDTTINYNDAMILSDAIITDAYCGITCEALPLDKPILMLYRDSNCEPYHEVIEQCNYRANNDDDIHKFVEMVLDGQDIKREYRNSITNTLIKHFDGENGKRIKEFVIEKFYEKWRRT